MKKIVTALFIVAISGCASKAFVAKTTYEPTKTITLGFEAESFKEKEYKIDAKNKADEFCGKPARFIGDELRNEGPSSAWGVLSKDKNKYVTFICD